MQEIYDVLWENSRSTAVALGYFDGVHIGHRFLISEMENYAKKNHLDKGIFTFTKSVNLGHKGKDILSEEQKLSVMQSLKIDLFYSPDFSVFSQLTPREFVEQVLIKSMGAKAVFCGENFLFGKNRSGTTAVLKELCSEHNIEVFILPTITLDGQTVSSTAIRQALGQGDMERVNVMLGRPYSVDFTVVHGKSLGKTLGTPTINQVYPSEMCTPKEGVYITKTTVEGKAYPSATGFGTRPTVEGENQSCETFIKDFSGDLYNKNIKVEFYKYLYPPQKFDTTQELGAMILSAAEQSANYFSQKL
ncbi:MAG: riboflavin biosynthesis protein RibF [Oscillospiraceae bacterium]